jgi:tetratricopeptide (TPR) repeat protein
MRRAPHVLLGLALAALLAAHASVAADLKDLYFGEALWQAHQGRYFEALERLDAELAQHRRVDEPQLDSLNFHIRSAEFSVGDFELNYRMHYRAGRAIKAVLEADVDELVRNEAAFRLARIHFQKDQPEDALHALERSTAKCPSRFAMTSSSSAPMCSLALGRPADAVAVLKRLPGCREPEVRGLQPGIALCRKGSRAGPAALDRAGQVSKDNSTAAIRDKVEYGARPAHARVGAIRPGAAVVRSCSPGRALLESGTAQRRLGGRLRAQL